MAYLNILLECSIDVFSLEINGDFSVSSGYPDFLSSPEVLLPRLLGFHDHTIPLTVYTLEVTIAVSLN